MKYHIIIAAMALTILGTPLAAQEKGKEVVSQTEMAEEKFMVYGNCGMCEKKIEGALNNVEGVSAADWNMKSHYMTVTFNPGIITLDSIKQRIADVGYDTDTHRASDEVYEKLHKCCQYERPKK